MQLPALFVVLSVATFNVGGVPVDFSNVIFMPGEFPITFDIDNSGEGRGLNYNGPSNNILPGSAPGRPSLVREIDGRQCGLPYGTIGYNGTCQRLLAKGPCSNGQWLVKRNGQDDAECVTRPCPQGQLQYQGRCVNITDGSVCNEGQMLYVDFTGEVHCDCLPNFFYDPWHGKCFAQHDRGSCDFGKHLQVTESNGVKCVPNPCVMEGFALHNISGKCYRKMYRGVCQHPDTQSWHQTNMTTECITFSTHSVFDLPTLGSCPPGSVRDLFRRCREEFRVPAEITYRSFNSECQLGFVKDAAGFCRKTHKLLG